MPQIFDYNGLRNSTHPLFRYVEDGVRREIQWGTALRAIHVAARITRGLVGPTTQPIAILANTGE
jgi:hypothetical protein